MSSCFPFSLRMHNKYCIRSYKSNSVRNLMESSLIQKFKDFFYNSWNSLVRLLMVGWKVKKIASRGETTLQPFDICRAAFQVSLLFAVACTTCLARVNTLSSEDIQNIAVWKCKLSQPPRSFRHGILNSPLLGQNFHPAFTTCSHDSLNYLPGKNCWERRVNVLSLFNDFL